MPFVDINSRQTISGAQKQFNSAYPFLKIEFFREAAIPGKGNPKSKMITTDMTLVSIQKNTKSGRISINKETSVHNLEEEFANEYGLFVQVFRKSGRIWLETIATDNWTLDQQNEEGRSLEEQLK